MKISLLYITALIIGAGSVSCEKPGSGAERTDTPAWEQGFDFGTRADASGNPVHGDPYTIISYRVGGQTSTNVDKYQIRDVGGFGRQWGYYAYDDGLISNRPAGTLVPVAMSHPTNASYTTPPAYWPSGWTSGGVLNKESKQAQMLNSVPAAGPNPTTTNQGVYRVAMLHPAIPMRNTLSANLGYLAVFNLGDDVYASMPDDANGDGVEDDPFEITVENNGQVHLLPAQTELYPLKSAVKLWFYSEYYADSDPLHTNPLTQTFSINTLRLYNIGSNGWYNARTGIVYPNYNYNNTWWTSYSMEDSGSILPNYVDMTATPPAVVTPGPGENGNPIQYAVEQPVFPSDYRGIEGGGLFEVKPLTLALALNMGGTINNVSVPIALKMERGKRYNFYINVTSELIYVTYNVSPWGDGGISGDNNLGGDQLPYKIIDLEYGPGAWGDGGGGNDDIGN